MLKIIPVDYSEITEALWYETTCIFEYQRNRATGLYNSEYLLSLIMSAGAYTTTFVDFYVTDRVRFGTYLSHKSAPDYVMFVNAKVNGLATPMVRTFMAFYPKILVSKYLEQSPVEIICTP